MENNFKELIEKYKYGKGIRHFSNKYNKEIGNMFFAQIKNMKDVNDIITRTNNKVNKFKNFKHKLFMEDIEEIEIQLGKYELALIKIISMNDYILKPQKNEFKCTVEEFNKMLSNLKELNEILSDINLRLCCQN